MDIVYGLKLTNKKDEEIAVARAHYKDFYDNRYIIMHEYLDNGLNFNDNQNIPVYKKKVAFPWQAYFYESGWYYQLIYDTEKETFLTPPKKSGAYLGNGYFEYRNLEENYFGLIHLDGHINDI